MAKKAKKTQEAPVVLKQVVVAEAPKSWLAVANEKLEAKKQ